MEWLKWIGRAMKVAAIAIAAVGVCRADVPAEPAGTLESPGVQRWQKFRHHQYAEYTLVLNEELQAIPVGNLPLNLGKLVAFAITLDKTQQQNSAATDGLCTGLAKSPDALRYFRATQRLLSGDVSAVSLYFDGVPPNFEVWGEQTSTFREHGYPLAANVFEAVTMTGGSGPAPVAAVARGVAAWMAIPVQQRTALDAFLKERIRKNWHLGQLVTDQLLRGVCLLPNVGARSQWLDLALELQGEPGFTLEQASAVAEAGDKADAVTIALRVAARNAQDPVVRTRAAAFVSKNGTLQQAEQAYTASVAALRPPVGRDVRLQYVAWRQAQGLGMPRITGVPETLLDGDASAADGKWAAAAAAYRAVAEQTDLDDGLRADAWAGILQVDPSEALEKSKRLDISKMRPEIASWAARRLCNAVNGALHTYKRGARQGGDVQINAEALRAGLPWLRPAADLLYALIERAPTDCLAGEGSSDLRITAALLYSATGQTERADGVLRRTVTYSIPAPLGGWRGPFGAPGGPDVDKPRTDTTPGPGDTEAWLAEVRSSLNMLGLDTAEGVRPLVGTTSPGLNGR